MAFSVEADLNLSDERLIELTDSADAPGVKDQDVINMLHLRATSKVEAAVYGKYALSDDDFPPILTQLEADLWRYYLYEHREVMETPAKVQKAYDAAVMLLEKYRTGEEALAAAHVSAATAPSPTGGTFSSDSDNRVFGRAKDWI